MYTKARIRGFLHLYIGEEAVAVENGFQPQSDINIGFAVSLRAGGVMIPANINADKKSLDELMAALNDIIPRARAMKLKSSELSPSTITITVSTIRNLVFYIQQRKNKMST